MASKKLISPEDLERLELITDLAPSSIIAGGFVRDTELGRDFKDIDVYIARSEYTDKLVRALRIKRTSKDYPDSDLITGQIEGSDINVIVVKNTEDNLDLVNYVHTKFDVGLCMCWINMKEGTTELTPEFIEDRDNKTLTVHLSNVYKPKSSAIRWFKPEEGDADQLTLTLTNHIPRLLKKYPDYDVRINYDTD